MIKKASAKKLATKKVATKKEEVKKATTKKTVSKTVTPKKTETKKTSVKKIMPKKSVSKKLPTKKVVVKKIKTEKEINEKTANRLINGFKKPVAVRKPKTSKVQPTTKMLSLKDAVIEGMLEKKANQIVQIDISKIEHRVADWFIICEADSKTHVKAIADSITDYVLKQAKEKPYKSEGFENSEWIVLDYVKVVVHVFLNETRAYYKVEELWKNGVITHIN